MHKKLGPLETWQWAAILAGLLLVYYEYEKHSSSSAAAAATPSTSSTDTSGPIDPTTGIPYADEIGSGAGPSGAGGGYAGSTGSSTDPGYSLQQELSDLGAIEGLMPGLGTGTTTNISGGLSAAQTRTLNHDLTTLNKTLKGVQKAVRRPPRKHTKHADHKNPGHHVTTHPGGKKTARSSAPHNALQHHNIAAPSHQRAAAKPYAIKPPAAHHKKKRRH